MADVGVRTSGSDLPISVARPPAEVFVLHGAESAREDSAGDYTTRQGSPSRVGANREDNEAELCGLCLLVGCCWFGREFDASGRSGGYLSARSCTPPPTI